MPYAAPPGADLRELLDGGGAYRLDVLVTDDANVIAYASGRANYLVVALPWSVTYVLVPARATPVIGSLTPEKRDAIAHNALTADARGAAEPFPWLTDSSCAITASIATDRAGQVIGYPAGNATARELAERVVSLAARATAGHRGSPLLSRTAPSAASLRRYVRSNAILAPRARRPATRALRRARSRSSTRARTPSCAAEAARRS